MIAKAELKDADIILKVNSSIIENARMYKKIDYRKQRRIFKE